MALTREEIRRGLRTPKRWDSDLSKPVSLYGIQVATIRKAPPMVSSRMFWATRKKKTSLGYRSVGDCLEFITHQLVLEGWTKDGCSYA